MLKRSLAVTRLTKAHIGKVLTDTISSDLGATACEATKTKSCDWLEGRLRHATRLRQRRKAVECAGRSVNPPTRPPPRRTHSTHCRHTHTRRCIRSLGQLSDCRAHECPRELRASGVMGRPSSLARPQSPDADSRIGHATGSHAIRRWPVSPHIVRIRARHEAACFGPSVHPGQEEVASRDARHERCASD